MINLWGWRPWRKGWGGRGWGWGRGIGPVPVQMPQSIPENAIPLERVPPGTKVKVVAVLAGANAQNRALQMGIAPGAIIEVVDNNLMYPWTPVIVRIHNMTVAIGRGLASRILVVPLGPGEGGGTAVEDKSGIRES